MGLNLGGILSSIHLPKIDFGSIGKTVLDEGKKILGDVVKDSFTLSSNPGEVFADNMNLNVLGDNIRLPNPVGKLANKLLGSADNFLGQYGVNLDFKKMAEKFFNLPTEKGGTVSVPSVQQRLSTPTPPVSTPTTVSGGAAGVGGGGTVSSSAVVGSGADATGGASAVSSSDPFNGVAAGLGSDMKNLNGQITDLMNNKDMDPTDKQTQLMQLQQKQQSLTECLQLLSNIMKDEHDARMAVVNNIRS